MFVIVDGDLYDSFAQMIYYDVDGEELGNDYIEFVNEDLRSQTQLVEEIFELANSQVSIQNESDICDVSERFAIGIAFGLPGVFAGTVTAGLGWLLAGIACSEIYNYFSPSGQCS